MSVARWGPLSCTWAPRGQQPLVKTRGLRQGLRRFGAISCHEGTFGYREALAYPLTLKACTRRKAEGVPGEVVAQLAPWKGSPYPT